MMVLISKEEIFQRFKGNSQKGVKNEGKMVKSFQDISKLFKTIITEAWTKYIPQIRRTAIKP